MGFDPDRHHRRSIRLPDYGYAQVGAYFIPVCSDGRRCLFGEVTGDGMHGNVFGRIVTDEWVRTGTIRPQVAVDSFVVMPNHLHGILIITDDPATGPSPGAAGQRADHPAPSRSTVEPGQASGRANPALSRNPESERFGRSTGGSIPTIVRLFKSATTRAINRQRGTPGQPVWQRNYYEHVIRHEAELQDIRRYILDNPARWACDHENPDHTPRGTTPNHRRSDL